MGREDRDTSSPGASLETRTRGPLGATTDYLLSSPSLPLPPKWLLIVISHEFLFC